METREFIELTRATVARLAPKLAEAQAGYIQSSAGAGAWDAAVGDLTGYLAEEQIPVTPDDRDNLRRLLTDLGESTEDVDRLTVESAASS